MVSDSKVAIKLFLLASLVPPRGRTKQKSKNSWKPSIAEARDSLIVHIRGPGDLDATKKKQVDFAFSKGIALQPYIILIGPNLSNITGSMVIINQYEHKCNSVIEALDFCFKSYQILDAEYPFASMHLWYLIQWKVYTYFSKKDPQIPYLNELL